MKLSQLKSAYADQSQTSQQITLKDLPINATNIVLKDEGGSIKINELQVVNALSVNSKNTESTHEAEFLMKNLSSSTEDVPYIYMKTHKQQDQPEGMCGITLFNGCSSYMTLDLDANITRTERSSETPISEVKTVNFELPMTKNGSTQSLDENQVLAVRSDLNGIGFPLEQVGNPKFPYRSGTVIHWEGKTASYDDILCKYNCYAIIELNAKYTSYLYVEICKQLKPDINAQLIGCYSTNFLYDSNVYRLTFPVSKGSYVFVHFSENTEEYGSKGIVTLFKARQSSQQILQIVSKTLDF